MAEIVAHYLQPLDKNQQKDNLRDGYIERPIHGAQHALRSAIWAKLILEFLRKHRPDFINSILQSIAQFIDSDLKTVELILFLTIAGHDAKRETEAEDLFEVASSDLVKDILVKLGIPADKAALFSDSIKHKHVCTPEENKLLNPFAWTLITELLRLADIVEIVRCTSSFHMSRAFSALDEIAPNLTDVEKDEFIALTEKTAEYIQEQGDLIWDCQIFIPKSEEETIKIYPRSFSLKLKVAWEHSTDLFSLLWQSIQRSAQLSPYLLNADLFQLAPDATIYDGPVVWPYQFHGTSASTLAALPASDYSLCSTFDLIQRGIPLHHGELVLGGYLNVGGVVSLEYPPGNIPNTTGMPSFVHYKESGASYPISRIIADYALPATPLSPEKCLEDFNNALIESETVFFSNINLILFYFARALQFYPRQEILQDDALQALEKKLGLTLDFFRLLSWLGRYIFPDGEKFNAISKSNPYAIFICEAKLKLSFKELINKISESGIDFTVKNPSKETLQRALDIFRLQKPLGKQKTKETQFFSLDSKNSNRGVTRLRINLEEFTRNAYATSGPEILLAELLRGTIPYKDWALFSQITLKSHIAALIQRIQWVKQLAEQGVTCLPDFKNDFPADFGVIFGTTRELYLHDFKHQEYRSLHSLRLGTDIDLIATDTEEHVEQIKRFLEKHNLRGIQVILFADLKKFSKKREELVAQAETPPSAKQILNPPKNSRSSWSFWDDKRIERRISTQSEKPQPKVYFFTI